MNKKEKMFLSLYVVLFVTYGVMIYHKLPSK